MATHALSGRPHWAAVHSLRWGALLVGVLLLQWATSAGQIPPYVFPQPTELFGATFEILQTAEFRSDLWRTISETLLSTGLGVAVGVPLGAVLARWHTAATVLEPVLALLYVIPLMLIYPILLVLLGVGMTPIVVLAAFIVFVPVTLNTLVGIRAINPVLSKMSRSFGVNPVRQFRHVLLPASLPLVVPGIQLGLIFGLNIVIGLEFLVSDGGLGYRINYLYQMGLTTQMWAVIIFVMIFGMGMVAALSALTSRIRRDL